MFTLKKNLSNPSQCPSWRNRPVYTLEKLCPLAVIFGKITYISHSSLYSSNVCNCYLTLQIHFRCVLWLSQDRTTYTSKESFEFKENSSQDANIFGSITNGKVFCSILTFGLIPQRKITFAKCGLDYTAVWNETVWQLLSFLTSVHFYERSLN